MSITLSTGTAVAYASTYGTGFTITAISNANPAVATLSSSHGVIVGDYIEVTSGWDLLTGKVVRVSAVSTNDVSLEGINTSSTTDYPAGSGTGTGREITAWTSISQIQGVTTSGGDQQYADVSTITDRIQKQLPTVRSAEVIDIAVFYDPSLTWFTGISALSASAQVALRFVFPNSSRLLVNGTFSLKKTPTIAVNAPLTTTISVSAVAESVAYSS